MLTAMKHQESGLVAARRPPSARSSDAVTAKQVLYVVLRRRERDINLGLIHMGAQPLSAGCHSSSDHSQ
jgi:hypothetical protein